MKVFLKGHNFGYEMGNIARLFYRDVTVENDSPPGDLEEYVSLVRTQNSSGVRLLCVLQTYWFKAHKDATLPLDASDALCERTLAGLMFDLLCLTTETPPPWGILTGVRPAKFAASLSRDATREQVLWKLCTDHRVATSKAGLALDVAEFTERCACENTPESVSLYVSIPFCPSRCSYCSFVSKTVGRDLALVENYLDVLCRELRETAEIMLQLNLRLRTIYIGGGTPSVLTAAQLERLCRQIGALFDIGALDEYCVEAGRPDTITPEKLGVLKAAGVTRLSVNPQTASDEVLRRIGRAHTAADAERAFYEARAAGFVNINADLIAGLPGDSLLGFARTLEWLFEFSPENVTLHALTRKRAARMTEDGGEGARDTAAMIDLGHTEFCARGYIPYYMYRQKGTDGGLENTGYTLPDFACAYNIYMMEELHSVLACGAGAVTKLVNQQSGRIERIYNYKYPAEYVAGYETLAQRKKEIITFYESKI